MIYNSRRIQSCLSARVEYLLMHELTGNLHMHTPYSDGASWHGEIAKDAIQAGLDFIVVTDHNIWVNGVEGYYTNNEQRVLLLVGEEVHNPRRQPQASHFLAYGANTELAQYAYDPQKLIDETTAAGGYGFLAHPFDPDAPLFNEGSLGWHNWEVDGYTGLEIWNYMSDFKGHLSNRFKALRVALNPKRYINGPQPATLDKWDELLKNGKRIAAIGNSDAHAFKYQIGPYSLVIFPYEFLFRAINTHILVGEELNGELIHDKSLVLEAIGNGNAWIGYDMAHSTKGFRFSGQSQSKGIMGDRIKMGSGATLQVKTPAKCNIRLLRNGVTVAECHDDSNLTHIPIEQGAYRVECKINYLGKKRGWIYSNPIYLE